jgi:MATE family multidrug resistance protein
MPSTLRRVTRGEDFRRVRRIGFVLAGPRVAGVLTVGPVFAEIFTDLSENIKLGLAGTAMTASEWWSWEIIGLASSFLGPEALAAQSVLTTSASFFYQVPYALSVAAAVRVGNLLGAQRPGLARTASRVTMLVAIAIAGVNSILLLCLRYRWGRFFSSEPEVIQVVADVLPLVAAFQLVDGLSGATGGLLRGAGKSAWGALINLLAYYAFGIPVGIAVTFAGPKLGLEGLWVGLTVALTGTGIITSAVIWRMNWEKCSEQARLRAGVAKRDVEEE